MKLSLPLVIVLAAGVANPGIAQDSVPRHSAVVELIGTVDGATGADARRRYYPVRVHEVVVDPNALFLNPALRAGLSLQAMDGEVKIPSGKARLFVKPPDSNSGAWLLVKSQPLR